MAGPLSGSSEAAPAIGGDGPDVPIAWYLGRDGRQFGPISDPEFRQAWDEGKLQPTDLVWREGFSEWRQIASMPKPPGLRPQPQPKPPANPVRHDAHAKPAPSTAKSDAPRQKRERGARGRIRGRVGAILGVLFFLIMLPAAAFVVWTNPDIKTMALALLPHFGDGFDRVVATAPLGGFAKTAEATDQAMQKARLWRVLKRYHGDWYTARVKQATEAAVAGKPDGEIVNLMMQEVVKLRRQYAGDATSASLPRLKSIASLFAGSLVELRKRSIDACYQYASSGEGAPAVVSLLQTPELTSALQAQLVATFEAIEEGRHTPRVYPVPKQQDFDALVKVLQTHGWQDKELQLFSDSKALAQAAPETVCRLVTEWFQSQLAVPDPDAQMRLLVDSLRPMVAG